MLFSLSTAALAFMFAPAPAQPLTGHKKILADAAELVRKYGHAKHVLTGLNGELCIQGAIFKAATGNSGWPRSNHQARYAMAKALRAAEAAAGFRPEDHSEPFSETLASWNNNVATKNDVVKALRKAAYA